ncbi:MAG: hypothetical protein IJZ64_03155 [Ruminococcus sp.]|nr:hypothetical protein [Ruminococcus sp.]
MNRISSGQFTVILLISSAFSFMCTAVPFSAEQMIASIIAIAIQIILCIPILFVYKKGLDLEYTCSNLRWITLLPIIYFLIRGSQSFVQIWNVSDSLSLPFSGDFLATAMIALVCLYTASLGIKALARSTTMVFGILIFTLAVMLIGAYQNMHLQNLSFSPDNTIIKSVMYQLSYADELPILLILLAFTSGNRTKSTMCFFGGSLILWEFILFLGITVLGRLMKTSSYPFFMIANVSQPFSTQRSDALYLILFVLLCVMRITLFTVLSEHLLGIAFPKFKKYRSTACLLVMLIAASGFQAIQTEISRYNFIIVCFLMIFLPIIFFIQFKHYPKCKGEVHQ